MSKLLNLSIGTTFIGSISIVTVLLLSPSVTADDSAKQFFQKQEKQPFALRVAAKDGKQTKAKPSVNNDNSKRKQTNAGLRSDGELVQAKKPKKLIGHELSHVKQQQGRVLTSSDWNASKQPNAKKQEANTTKPVRTQSSGITNKKRVSDSHDRFANSEVGHQAYSVPLQKATVSNIRSEQLDNSHRASKQIKVNRPIGAKCNPRSFPKNAVIEQSGKRQTVECYRGNLVLKRGIFTSRPKVNDPKQPKKKIKSKGLSDEMPEDLPAG